MAGTSESSRVILRYHEETKHHPHRYARSSGSMDWSNEPVLFRFYEGSERILLPLLEKDRGWPYEALYQRKDDGVPLSLASVAALLELSLGLSVWKQYGSSRWVLRMNPSSGNLHPTECSLILPPIGGHVACLVHYNPLLHCLEKRAFLESADSRDVERIGGFGVILSSIFWREAWKYGERAFRYCHHDVGHALGGLCVAANLNGWRMRMQVSVADDRLDRLLGFDLFNWDSPEEEHADCLCWVGPGAVDEKAIIAFLEKCRPPSYKHAPNRLSREHVEWPIIPEVARHSRSPGIDCPLPEITPPPWRFAVNSDFSAEAVIRKRRSAQAFDPVASGTDFPTLLQILARTIPAPSPPFDCFPLTPRVHLAIFAHQVDGLPSGLYCLVRNAAHFDRLRAAMDRSFEWTAVKQDFPMYRLMTGDFRRTSATISCHQEIAGDSAFSLGMIAQFEAPLREAPWLYPRLFWECGLIGQVLYLEAEAHGMRGTGIGCFFDDLMHDRLGLNSREWQDLYHFTVGKSLDDPRLQSKPPYSHLQQGREG
jgi:SagB-type dehydrogenase family enzyme